MNTIPSLGFRNTGAICYFNALLQCLFSASRFLTFTASSTERDSELFHKFYKDIANDQWNLTFSTLLLQTLQQFHPNQSSSEYFLAMMDHLKWDSLFECRHRLLTQCEGCGNKKESFDISYNPFINQSFSELFETECRLEGVLCDGCHQKTQMLQSRTLSQIPDVLSISLNKYMEKKVIDYPAEFTALAHHYRLVGVVDHFGMLMGGHYAARIQRENSYFMVDDERVHPISSELFQRVMPETYMIFYERSP